MLAVMLIASVFGVLSVPGIKDRLKRQIVSIPKEIKTAIAIDSTSPRARLTIEGIKMAINSRGLGVGPGNFEWHIANKSVPGTPNPHNWWLELLAEYGILVLIGYILIYIKLIISTFRRWKSDRYWSAGATLVALLVFPILAVAPSRLIWYSPHWLLLAFSGVYLHSGKTPDTLNSGIKNRIILEGFNFVTSPHSGVQQKKDLL